MTKSRSANIRHFCLLLIVVDYIEMSPKSFYWLFHDQVGSDLHFYLLHKTVHRRIPWQAIIPTLIKTFLSSVLHELIKSINAVMATVRVDPFSFISIVVPRCHVQPNTEGCTVLTHKAFNDDSAGLICWGCFQWSSLSCYPEGRIKRERWR